MDTLTQIHTFIATVPYWPWIVSVLIATAATIITKVILKIIAARFRALGKYDKSAWHGAVIDIFEGLRAWVVFVIVFSVSARPLNAIPFIQRLLAIVLVIATAYQIAIWGLSFIKYLRVYFLKNRIEQEPSSAAALGLLYTTIQVLFLATIALIALSNLGVDVTALIAGLGVGGIAVALAAQNVLGDLLASLSIVLDKPFVIGDFIVAGTEKGTVELMGIKTTRLRSLSGEELVLSNKDLLESRIQNFKRMWRRRVVQLFGVVYSTPVDVLAKIPDWVKELVEKEQMLTFDRCHLMRYGTSSLDYELVFFVDDPDYNKYMDVQQRVLLGILQKFTEEKVDFAFPTQTVHMEKVAGQGPGLG
jgi:small-conductance mechanosensitive channel